MAYNSKMTSLPIEERAKFLEEVFALDYGEASNDVKKYCLGGAAPFVGLSRKAIACLNSIDRKIVPMLAACCKTNDLSKAYSIFRRIGLEKHGLVAEHTIPCSVIYDWVMGDRARQTRESFYWMLQQGVFVQCGITNEEDFYLNQAGLNQKMPISWNRILDNTATFIRYDTVGIVPVMLKSL